MDVVGVVERLILAGVAVTARALAGGGGIDLTFPQWRVIVVLGASPMGATVSEVSARIGVTLPATSRQLRRLERRNLVRTAPDDLDRRATRAHLSDEGERVWRRILEFRHGEIERTVGKLDLPTAAVAAMSDVANAMAEFA